MYERAVVIPEEIDALATRFGEPQREHVRLDVSEDFFLPWEGKFYSRRGEVMFLLPRPGGLLVHRKAHYPPNVWRLLTGGIELGEAVEEALLREAEEEVGFTPPVRRFVGLLTYDIGIENRRVDFATYIFLMAYSDHPIRQGEGEEIDEAREVPLAAMRPLAEQLRTLPGRWQDWGRFRAVAHDLVAQWVREEEVQPE